MSAPGDADPGASLFEPAGDHTWLPTEYSRGPWDPGALHGGPVAALVAREVERVPAPAELHTARLTLELLRPVPLEPLAVRAEVTRPGRKVQGVAVTVTVAGSGLEVTRATAQRIRRDETLHPEDHVPAGAAPPERSAAPPFVDDPPPVVYWSEPEQVAFHSHSVEHRIVSGGFDRPGPTVDWLRLDVPVVAGESPSPWQRMAAVADFGNGISGLFHIDDFTFINPDLTIAVAREPVGEWICLDAITWLGSGAVGLAESALFDREGRIGRAIQTLLFDRNR
ncbi:MAG TPA: thioesterase family protein [Acidimicrobiales bacterium]|nr:thioesterase family protein [Acidimicrobiales bacterium]